MSTLASPANRELAAILAEYGSGEARSCTRIDKGYVNEKWVLEIGGGRYLLKRRHASLGSPSLVQAQHALVRHLRCKAFPAPVLIPTRSGKTQVEYSGEVYELQEYILGDAFDPAQPDHLAAAAHMLGFYHNSVSGFDHQALHRVSERYGPVALSWIARRLQKRCRASMTPELQLLFQVLDKHVRDLENRFLEFGRLPELVIHGDYHGENLVFQGHKVVGVLDYDLAHWCSRALEVAEALIAFCTDPGLGLKRIVYPGALDLEQAHRFVAAYLHQVTLTEAEIRALPDLLRTIWLCAALDPPLEPLLSREAAPQALPEILALAEWALAHGGELVAICLAARESSIESLGPLSD